MNWAFLSRTLIHTAILFGCLAATGAESGSQNQTSLDPDLKRFTAQKRELEKRLAEKHEISVPPIVWSFFDAAQKGDWRATTNHFQKIKQGTESRGSERWMPPALWSPVHDVLGAYEQVNSWNPRLLRRFGDTIIARIPAGSIYFGGTDPGRFVISALSTSHNEGRPFYTVTQNALADVTYLDYLREMYGGRFYVPTVKDSERTFQEYVTDAGKRLEIKQLKEGEEVKYRQDGRVEVSGIVAVMAINELLARLIIDKNPSHEIYLEESHALESLYGQSVPHGLIFKVNHQTLDQLPLPIIEADHQFWTDECRALIGPIVREDTSVSDLCAWSLRIFLNSDLKGFQGDPAYVKDSQAPQYFSQCRSAIAAYYEWWSRKSSKTESSRLDKEADFAHRQAVSLSPFNPAVVFRYAEYLQVARRTNDAKILIDTMLKIDPAKHMEIDSDKLKRSLKKLESKARELAGPSAASRSDPGK